MDSLQKYPISDGWVRTDASASTACELTDTTAICNLRFVGIYASGKRIQKSGLYTLAKKDDWIIVAVSPNRPGLLVGCIGDA